MVNIKTLFLLLSFIAFSQNEKNIDYEHIFKKWIYIEKTSEYILTEGSMNTVSIKNDSVFNLFKDNIKLKITDLSNNLPNKYIVKCLLLNNENVINTNQDLTPYNFDVNSFFYNNQCDGKLVLVFDIEKGTSYRIAGFNGNDLISLLFNIQEYYYKNYKKISFKSIIKKHHIKDIDLLCMYKGLKSERLIDYKEYPCLKSCFDEFIVF
ncbi:hypothetical protein NAT47_00320 [Flavobacterium sp. HXWNR69]|uniref:Uncharacterized protein n=1 Tax=Flavobacterium fragile TaxID=2949085 RepID=A0ABT0TEG1_9FLAO|nr:hypothetical protein [Flavobacterium sp. HXWNR69]MCL9768855.1 hypothetical protein [Flavobacterium sp. HXWNR69]